MSETRDERIARIAAQFPDGDLAYMLARLATAEADVRSSWRMHANACERHIALGIRIMTAFAANRPLIEVLDLIGDDLNEVDAVDDESIALYERAKAAVARQGAAMSTRAQVDAGLPARLAFNPDGTPDVEGLPYKDLGYVSAGTYLLRRYFIVGTSGADDPKVVVHHLLRSDDDRAFHDHPWDFTTFILSGRYIEHTPEGATEYQSPAVLQRPAEHLHWLELPDGPVWTLLLIGARRRHWGFWAPHMAWTPWAEFAPGAGTRP